MWAGAAVGSGLAPGGQGQPERLGDRASPLGGGCVQVPVCTWGCAHVGMCGGRRWSPGLAGAVCVCVPRLPPRPGAQREGGPPQGPRSGSYTHALLAWE